METSLVHNTINFSKLYALMSNIFYNKLFELVSSLRSVSKSQLMKITLSVMLTSV